MGCKFGECVSSILCVILAWRISEKTLSIKACSGPYFPAFGMNMEIWYVNLRTQPKYGKTWTAEKFIYIKPLYGRIFPHLDWVRRLTMQMLFHYLFSPNTDKCGPEKLRILKLFTERIMVEQPKTLRYIRRILPSKEYNDQKNDRFKEFLCSDLIMLRTSEFSLTHNLWLL